VQHAVDRRFNRARYDADQTIAEFAGRLKDAVDLEAIRDDLAGRCRSPSSRPTSPCGPPRTTEPTRRFWHRAAG